MPSEGIASRRASEPVMMVRTPVMNPPFFPSIHRAPETVYFQSLDVRFDVTARVQTLLAQRGLLTALRSRDRLDRCVNAI
jgi:hypothetical protein